MISTAEGSAFVDRRWLLMVSCEPTERFSWAATAVVPSLVDGHCLRFPARSESVCSARPLKPVLKSTQIGWWACVSVEIPGKKTMINAHYQFLTRASFWRSISKLPSLYSLRCGCSISSGDERDRFYSHPVRTWQRAILSRHKLLVTIHQTWRYLGLRDVSFSQ